MNVVIKGKLEELVNRKVREGYYENAGEVVRDALRRLEAGSDGSSKSGASEVALAQVREIDALLDVAKGQLDQLSEISEEESLRLQMAMDRMSKLMQTLSNILEKIDDTAQSITQNLK